MKGSTNHIAWHDRGNAHAPPLLLVRPLGGSVDLWGTFATNLERDFRVVTFDARGSGHSSGSPRFSTRAMAEDALGVLDARSIDRAHVFGISLGGMVAQRLAISFPSRVRGLVLASTATRGLAFERARLGRAMRFAACMTHASDRVERCLVRRVLSPAFRAERPEEVERITDLAAQMPSRRRTILAHAIAAHRHDASTELSRISAATLVLAGNRDHLLGVKPAQDLARRIPHAEMRVIEDAGHDLTLEQPTKTADSVRDFLLHVP